MDRMKVVSSYVNIIPETTWTGTPGVDRCETVIESSVKGIIAPFSAEDWCQIAMREGEHYVGSCCANMSALQDAINEVFRESGYIESNELLNIAQMAQGHDGFELFELGMDDETFKTYVDQWASLDPWNRLALVYQGLREKLQPKTYEVPLLKNEMKNPPSDEKQAIRDLQQSLVRLSWDDLVSSDDVHGKSLKRSVTLARALEPARMFVRELEKNMDELEGYAIVEKDTDEILSNTFGPCIYGTQAEADEIYRIFTGSQSSLKDNIEIVPVSVSVKSGVQVQRN